MKRGLLFLGIFLSVFLIAIMVRDEQYMEKLKELAGSSFPETGKTAPKGSMCGYIIVTTFLVVELFLLLVYENCHVA